MTMWEEDNDRRKVVGGSNRDDDNGRMEPREYNRENATGRMTMREWNWENATGGWQGLRRRVHPRTRAGGGARKIRVPLLAGRSRLWEGP